MVYSNVLENEEDIEVTDAYTLYLKALQNYADLLDADLITNEQYAEMVRYSTQVELPAYLADELNIDLDESNPIDYEYNENMSLAEFSAGNRFGAALLELGDVFEYDDLEEYILDLADATGVDPEDIVGCIDGDIEPDDDFVIAVAEALDLPEEYGLELLAAGYEARGEDLYELLAEDDEDYDDEDYEEDYYNEEEDATYSMVADLEDRLAEFEIGDALKTRLADIQELVAEGLEERWITPSKARRLLGSFNREEDRVAAFSQMAAKNGVDLDTQLFAVEYSINLDREAGPVVEFGGYVDEVYEPTNEDLEVAAQARRNVLASTGQFGI